MGPTYNNISRQKVKNIFLVFPRVQKYRFEIKMKQKQVKNANLSGVGSFGKCCDLIRLTLHFWQILLRGQRSRDLVIMDRGQFSFRTVNGFWDDRSQALGLLRVRGWCKTKHYGTTGSIPALSFPGRHVIVIRGITH